MPEPKIRTALAFMAHPDDAEFLCAGTLLRLAQRGWEIHIATAAPGDCGTTVYNRWDISSIRTQEAAKAMALAGGQYHCLDERDGLIVYNERALRKIYDLFRSIAPSLVFTHAPKDYMLDHEQASLLARSATFVYNIKNISAFPLREDAGTPWLYYCDPMEGIDPLGNPVTPTTYVDVTTVMEKKCEMLACHASQREWLLAHHGMDEYLESMRRHMTFRGQQIGVPSAEAFVQHRGHGYPREDLLATLFSSDETRVV